MQTAKIHPYFSIIIPMYNRERFIERAITSCLQQDFKDFEIIVVDDGSTDRSREVVRNKFSDPRITLRRHEKNLGVGPARNTGADAARGEWIVCLDSDDELLPDALSIIYKRTTEIEYDIARLQCMVQFENGEISPDPPLRDEIWDYQGYIQWLERCYEKRAETLPVVRRATFKHVRYANDRTLEGPYHLDFTKHFLSRSCPDIVRLYHFDADNQLITPALSRLLEDAPTQASGIERMLELHGDALRKWAPRVYANQISGLVTLLFLAGKRRKGLEYALRCLRNQPVALRIWTIIMFGLLGPKPLAWLKLQRQRRLMSSHRK